MRYIRGNANARVVAFITGSGYFDGDHYVGLKLKECHTLIVGKC